MNKKPNIVVFMADHYRGDMAPPFSRCRTPHLDGFYRDAAAFTNAYCPAPHCCPSRATFHTGLYPTQHGVWNNVNNGTALSRGLNEGIGTWSQKLAEAGYALHHCGKWHVSDDQGPEDYGWVNVYGNERPKSQNDWDRYKNLQPHTGPRRPGQLIREGYPNFTLYGESESPFDDEAVTQAAAETLRTCCGNPDQPFVLYCGTLGPHDPYRVPIRFLDLYDIDDIELPASFHDNMLDKPALYRRTQDRFGQLTPDEYRQAIRHYLAFCSYEDWLFGRLIQILKDTGQYDDTIVVFTSDHGDYCGEHGLFAKGLPCFRSAYHIPLLIRWPRVTEKLKSRAIETYASLADFAPTVLDWAGIPYNADDYAGRSLVPLLQGGHDGRPDEMYTQTNGNELYGVQRSVMTPEWKYVYNGFDYDELYDRVNDPDEMRNLAGLPEYRPVLRDMARKMWSFARKHGDGFVSPYIMVSLCEFGPGCGQP